MNTIIKRIRNVINMSQNEFAAWLGVSFATVNRWENGHAIPNKLAQTKLYDICKDKSIPVYDMILEKIQQASQDIKLKKQNSALSRF